MQTGQAPGRQGATGDRGRPLVVTADGDLLDELVTIATAGGVEVSVAVDALAAEEHWPSAPLVVVGQDQVAALVRRRLPRRLGVVLVARSGPPAVAPGAPTGPGSAPTGPGSVAAGPAWLPKPEAAGAWMGAEALYAEHVVVLPDARSWLAARFAECRPRALRHAAPVVAFVPGSAGAGASTLAVGVALTARRQGLSALLVGADQGGRHAELIAGSSGVGGSLAVLRFDRWDAASVPPEAMAAALRAARHGRDLVVVDLPRVLDDAARLALSCADRCYVVVAGEIRACAAASRVASVVRRHCPGTALVVRALVPGGLRTAEIAEALALPLAGVIPAVPAPARPSTSASPLRAVSGLCRRLLADSGARRRAVDLPVWPEPAASVRSDR